MRFGLFIPQGWRLDLVGVDVSDHWPTMLRVAQFAEAGPWESVWVYDHFHTTPVPTSEATHEAWTLMSALAASTSRIRLGQMCTCVGYRNPMYLAKVAATVDVISAGRLDMGIGAGWYEHEWNAYGYGFPGAGDRLGMLADGVEIMRQAWENGVATFSGEHYQVDGALCYPRPVQEGGIPFWVAGGGEKKTLKIAAKYASYTNYSGDEETFLHKSEVLAGHCRDLGRDFAEITRTADYNVVIGRDEAEVADRLARLEERYRPFMAAEAVSRTVEGVRNAGLVGTPEQIVEQLKKMQGHGLDYSILYFPEVATDFSGVELFQKEVVPALS
ncbi:LLM class F420-dependent oxidoreductase [Kineosporia sp. NBRC 101677]|uniref:LLM class F420-dependent oxidoreductase n=1 Tax=Kineosporia sp. NBRC 101677 TaxID=3032197 RepID=UPI0024A09AE0|nr:LLM class F420-dependent oxidoreductase [Kineosporia sp. NBRC 101677]GLY14817.1 LLM class F420-dependent oxidoreductase [Kineosporia sp. NBRC 101677]